MRTQTARSIVLAIALAWAAGVLACGPNPAKDAPITNASSPAMASPPPAIGGPDNSVFADFTKRVNEYMELHTQLDRSLNRLPDKAKPLVIDGHQRALAALIAKGRADAKVGGIFEPKMQTFIRAMVRSVIAGPGGATIKGSLMDENPMGVKIEINGRYPDTIPMSTMPSDVLSALPKLPDDLEYRFVGNRLILLDTAAHIIVDYVTDTFEI